MSVMQEQAIPTMVCQLHLANPFWCCLPEGAAEMVQGLGRLRSHCSVFPANSLESKSVWILEGREPAAAAHLLRQEMMLSWANDFKPQMQMNLVALSTRVITCQKPPMDAQSP